MLLDKVLSLATHGKEKYDLDGKRASRGVIDEKLLDQLLSNPFFDRLPPKSTGAELFGHEKAAELYRLVEGKRISLNDLMATLLALTVESVARSYERFIFPEWTVDEVILSGGGARNSALVERLRKRLDHLEFSTSDRYGIPADAKEALSFAILANELVSGNYTNLPSVTGARRPVPLGKIVLGIRNL
jgi:anhydro-N-acetylmuramic acid kinase